MNRDRHLRENIDRILEQGHRIMADDFGTGYTNFLATLEFPFSIIKLDRGFLHSDQELRYANMQGIIRLFHENGKQVVVEGVETRQQMEEAVSMGADYLQGFYLAKPMPKNEFLNFLRQAAGNS